MKSPKSFKSVLAVETVLQNLSKNRKIRFSRTLIVGKICIRFSAHQTHDENRGTRVAANQKLSIRNTPFEH